METSAASGSTPGFEKSQSTWAMFCHLSTLVGYVIPFGNYLGPFVVWLAKRREYPRVDDQGKEALNFQITLLLYVLSLVAIGGVLTLIGIGVGAGAAKSAGGVPPWLAGLGVTGILLFVFLFLALGVYSLVMTIVAAVRASGGENYRYPLTLRLIK